ncbi:MAG: PSD1 and planctomycete cytochrome C domain-containing protein [Planctomycetota bacterium]
MTTALYGEQLPEPILAHTDAAHVRDLALPADYRQETRLAGPLPSFVKVWCEGKPADQLEFSFNADATEITLHLGNRKPEKLQFLLSENTGTLSDGVVVCSALDATVVGKQAALETHPGNHRIGYWNIASDYVAWDANIRGGEYQVELVYSRATPTGTRVIIAIGDREFPITLEETGSWYRYRVVSLGDTVVHRDGKTRVEVRVDEIVNGGVMNLKAIVLTPKQAPSKTEPGEKNISFSHDVRQLLSDRCFLCHGPDGNSRQADLRLDNRDSATEWAIVPGSPKNSEVITRIISDDPEIRMPPPESNKPPLNPREIATLKRWIAEGAVYETHWAFEPPRRPTPPNSGKADRIRHPIDRFVTAKLDERGWSPSPRADKRTLIRRASFDLTGLPPSLSQINAFVTDESPNAWPRALDRLLDSSAYGEHQARNWLDAARYADTNGYQYDFQRDQWAWRDWVIAAFNENMPFDQFTIEQLAGDLLPGSTPQQRLATGFNRNHPITVEGGVIDEEYRVEYVLDRTTTIGTVWLGMTLGCARCHDHKYDPLTQKEFYQLSAFFNQVPERGLRGFNPSEKIISPYQTQQLKEAEAALQEAEDEFISEYVEWNLPLDELKQQLNRKTIGSWNVSQPESASSRSGSNLVPQPDNSILVSGINAEKDIYEVVLAAEDGELRALRLSAVPSVTLKNKWVGRSDNGNFVLSEIELEVSSSKSPDEFKPVKAAAAYSLYSQDNFEASAAIDGVLEAGGWAVNGKPSSVEKTQTAFFVIDQPVQLGEGAKVKVRLRFESEYARSQIGRFQFATTPSKEVAQSIRALTILNAQSRGWTKKEQILIAEQAADLAGTDSIRHSKRRMIEARERHQSLLDSTPTTMVMRDGKHSRGAYVLDRGEYDKRGEHVQADTPAWLPPMADDLPRNRLGLARWLTDADHPLTARVTVNRFWLQLFGIGLLDSPEDFGLQSQSPSHPELLDWLAVEFSESGWNVKEFLKTIMTSQTYQQSSVSSPETHNRDPDNRYLSRGPRLRLDAESIRDSVLAVSGLLNRKLGGPSVFPYHPKGLWLEVNNRPGYSSSYEQDTGDKLYRRSIYTFWKRTVTPPSMAVFDAPSREYCTVRRSRTNTPLQAFVMLHDPQFVEAARALAARTLTQGGQSLGDQIQYGFEVAVGRHPTTAELQVLEDAYHERLAHFRTSPKQASHLLTIGESPLDKSIPVAEQAAMTTVARLLLNLSEFITKE